MKKFAAIAILLALISPVAAAQSTVSGKWNATFTRTAPDGRSQSIPFVFDFTQKGKVLTGTIAPDADRIWPIEKGVVDGAKVTFQVQQPNGPLRSFVLTYADGKLEGDQKLEFNGQTADVKVVAERAK